MKGLISIIIPTFNRAQILPETLDSILSQSYEMWECIVVDDGSTDNTDDLLNTYAKSDSRFQYIKRPKDKPKGANACRNYGFEISKGDFINWFDSDDIMHPEFLQTRISKLIEEDSLDFCACLGRKFVKGIEVDALTIKPHVLISNNYLEDYLLNGLFFYTPAPLWRKRFLLGKELFDETMQRAQESDFHFRMLSLNPNYLYLEDALFYVRVGQESITKGADKSFLAQNSVFKYFNTVFNVLKNKKDENRLMEYVFYRQAVNYYNLNLLKPNFFERLKLFFSHSHYLVGYTLSTKKLKNHIVKIILGIGLILFFKKGYDLFYYPQYNYRTTPSAN
ncbi:glycosyltransferase family 2 protein [Winogradskyella vincentii]|uniref:Glycosyltransferase n=1 Tax=Winogradskyella vincentii TaxID=2877122 RepID=A0ABS7Y389_9FLAO|nr:glycosyltransferase family 2 protein [Winogradskyella vincentii]MCA0153719.1 glycosyltransferase [Winogradskyella vincentii]